MKRIALFLSIVALASCVDGGDSTSKSTSPQNVGVVEMRLASNGCVMSNNAEAVTDYLIGDKQARQLSWNCADYDKYAGKRIDVFALFNYSDQCYAKQVVSIASGRCGSPAKPVTAPLYATSLSNTSAILQPVPLGGGRYYLTASAIITNTGTVDVYATQVRVSVGDSLVKLYEQWDIAGKEIISPTQYFDVYTYESGLPLVIDSGITSGVEYKVTIEVVNAVGQITNTENVFVVAH